MWGQYLAKRSELVAYLAGQVQDHACQCDAEPVWVPPGTHPSTALLGELAMWRAANGIDPQDPRPTGGTQLETLPALWKQRLDRDIARATSPPADARADERQAGRTALSPSGHRQRPYQRGERRPSGRPRPADSAPQSSDRGALSMRFCTPRGDGIQIKSAGSGGAKPTGGASRRPRPAAADASIQRPSDATRSRDPLLAAYCLSRSAAPSRARETAELAAVIVTSEPTPCARTPGSARAHVCGAPSRHEQRPWAPGRSLTTR